VKENIIGQPNLPRGWKTLLFRKNKVRRMIRVPTISLNAVDIPPDEYPSRKYGQRPIRGSPYPPPKHLSN
ncbi:Probable WRKY transcription factor 21, partial [Striga hermonthica]